MQMSTLFLASFVIVATLSPVWGFQTVQLSSTSNPSFSSKQPTAASATTTNLRYSNWDVFETPDAMEIMIGGTRYEMVELPDSMMSTTLWVGNLCEFVTDEILSELFQQASSLKFVPACVARKPNMESMRYGFVAFRSEEEKETAMELLHGYELQGKCLKVESIRDHEKHGRIRAPQKIVDYAVGPIKRQRNGELNTMRRARMNTTNDGSNRINNSHGDGDDDGYSTRKDRRRTRVEKRKTRGRYKNQQRKNSRASRMMPRL
mmetsp:Transcript_8925/g.18885  ORF Transcript_8925/g.18885 Transcript_8925/m.18885 type:complete len:262 (-) Transcript_8925:233-1018(-)|eukprot:CAMPEP_0196131466 /NCGR_PEP_ID=MMETSP0910-20130528/1465_1 /TAXON_ID=49265 /ORGANISM="Thalassiosira rotula, Strain GSO102" /LENGTH=261 /DNA_ID=CAMNT_0041390937 /DNA_START=158 /DNA_END=943 /DNA_ORIENTATION=+